MNMEILLQYVTCLLMVIGVLAFMTSAIVQVIKEMPYLKKVQTNVVALVAAMIITPVAVVILCIYCKITIEWYYFFPAAG